MIAGKSGRLILMAKKKDMNKSRIALAASIVFLMVILAIPGCSVMPSRPVERSPTPETISPDLDTPTAVPATATRQPTCRVIGGQVNIRMQPTTHSTVVTVVRDGETLIILGRTETNWLKVENGYIYSEFCRE